MMSHVVKNSNVPNRVRPLTEQHEKETQSYETIFKLLTDRLRGLLPFDLGRHRLNLGLPIQQLRLLVFQKLLNQGRPSLFSQQKRQGFAHRGDPWGDGHAVFQHGPPDLVPQGRPIAQVSTWNSLEGLHGLLRGGHADKPHPRLLHGSANGPGIGLITDVRLDPRLDGRGRDHAAVMPELRQLLWTNSGRRHRLSFR